MHVLYKVTMRDGSVCWLTFAQLFLHLPGDLLSRVAKYEMRTFDEESHEYQIH